MVGCINGYMVITCLFLVFTGYAYLVNSKLKSNDLIKKQFHPIAIFPTLLWPLFILAWIILFILRALGYSLFIVIFGFSLTFIRKPFLLTWLSKMALKIGNKLLKANMLLIRLFLPQLE